MRKNSVWMISIFALLVFLVALPLATQTASGSNGAADPNGAVRLLAVNVGKADALLVFVQGKTYLIDTGTARSWGALRGALESMGIQRLDGVFLTHTDKDHMGGMASLASSSVTVDAWYASAMYTDIKKEKHPALLAAASRSAQVQWLKAGDEVAVSDTARFLVLGPITLDPAIENNNSLVMRLTTPQGDMLLAGDMEFAEEKALMDADSISPCEVLKVSHHGENDSTSIAFAMKVSPQVAVISTNSLEESDTPHKTVLAALKQAGAQIAVTQNAKGGVLVTLADKKAKAELVEFANQPMVKNTVQLTGMALSHETLSLSNTGSEEVSLAGWYVYSTRGEEIYFFPDDAQIGPGETKVLGTQATAVSVDFLWADKNVWHSKKKDEALLYDPYGRIVSRLSNGLTQE